MSDRERLSIVIMHAADIERSLRFYRDLLGVPLERGVNVPEDDPWYGGHHVELSWREGAYLHFALFPAKSADRTTVGAELGFHVDDVRFVHERMTAGSATVLSIYQDGGSWSALYPSTPQPPKFHRAMPPSTAPPSCTIISSWK
jgi:catechol 2,3-dioxygenase-like lactoylglutathione lyase family enzyme